MAASLKRGGGRFVDTMQSPDIRSEVRRHYKQPHRDMRNDRKHRQDDGTTLTATAMRSTARTLSNTASFRKPKMAPQVRQEVNQTARQAEKESQAKVYHLRRVELAAGNELTALQRTRQELLRGLEEIRRTQFLADDSLHKRSPRP